MRKVLITPFFFFILVVAGLAVVLYWDKHNVRVEREVKEFPVFLMPSLQEPGKFLSKEDLKGDIALVNVFASWCLVCRIEHGLFTDLKDQEYIKIFGINWKDDVDDANEWLKDLGNPYEKVIYDYNGDLITALGVTGVPETFIINANGDLIYSYPGAITDEIFEDEIRPIIERERKR